jgi:hypothetical protein
MKKYKSNKIKYIIKLKNKWFFLSNKNNRLIYIKKFYTKLNLKSKKNENNQYVFSI